MKRKRIIHPFIRTFLVAIVGITFFNKSTCLANELSDFDSKVIVSMGDSFSAGEGIEPFYGTKKIGSISPDYLEKTENVSKKELKNDWLAHRSIYSWPGRLTLPGVKKQMAYNRNKNWFFVASSGAVTADIMGEIKTDKGDDGKFHGQSKDTDSGKTYLDPQIKIFNSVKNADYVTISIGGNDVGFSDIVTTCATTDSLCEPNILTDKLNNVWQEFFTQSEESISIRDKIRQVYKNISDSAGPQANIIVAGYPQLFDPNGGIVLGPLGYILGAKFEPDEAKEIDKACSNFNNALKSIVEYCCKQDKLNISFVSVEEGFLGHGAYSDKAFLNPVQIKFFKDDLTGIDITDIKGSIISAESMHPNDSGAAVYAKCVQEKIDELEAAKTIDITPSCSLNVFDINKENYEKFHFSISSEKNFGIFNLFKKNFTQEGDAVPGTVTEFWLDEGKYIITITDQENSNQTYQKRIIVKKNAQNDTLNFYTDYGMIDDTEPANEYLPFGVVGHDGHYYFLYTGRVAGKNGEYASYKDAQEFCENLGGYLAVISDSKENSFLHDFINENGCGNAYFGLSDEDSDGKWKWSSEERSTYYNWSYGEPNGKEKGEKYAQFFYDDGTWNDGDFKNEIGTGGVAFICEWSDYEYIDWENIQIAYKGYEEHYLSPNIDNKEDEFTDEKMLIVDQNENAHKEYRKILEKYIEVDSQRDSAYLTAVDFDEKYQDINFEIITGGFLGDYELYYSYYDIDKNGIDELLVSVLSEYDDDYNVIAYYSFDGKKPCYRYPSGLLGYRCTATFYDNGIICENNYSGGGEFDETFIKIASDSYTFQVVGEHSFNVKNGEKELNIDGAAINFNWVKLSNL